MENLSGDSHGEIVMTSVNGDIRDQPITDGKILQSWARCVEQYALHPDSAPEPRMLSRLELSERQDAAWQLLDIAQAEMTNLYQQVAGSGYSILLTDSDGVVLNYVGDPLFGAAAASAGLVPGAMWSEQAQGTNGMGTCLVERCPLVVHHNAHFFTRHTRLTCSAAPIFDPQGDLVAVLDASSESHLAQQHTVALVNMSAQLIENRLFSRRMRDDFIIRFHARPEFLSTFGEGTVAFDYTGTITAANRSALFQLNFDTVDEIIGQSLEAVFNIRTEDAIHHAGSGKPTPLRDSRHGRRFFASYHGPVETKTQHRRRIELPSELDCDELHDLHFGDPRVQQNVLRARKLLEKDVPFIILGETGTGKDVFAKALHASSSRRTQPFVAVNCASLPETLIESELFGYRPGAFTGASKEGSRGKIVQADGGTLFLDEIGDMPLALQARLLRVLEERVVVPLGSEVSVPVDIRLVSATHHDLQQRVATGAFRDDLFYRLQGIDLVMPPLREREDKRELILNLLIREAEGKSIEMTEPALKMLEDYAWPGNIRQLRNTLRTLVGLNEDGYIRLDDLPSDILSHSEYSSEERVQCPTNALAIAEREALVRELEAGHWKVSRVAAKLKISRNTLYRKMKLHGITTPSA